MPLIAPVLELNVRPREVIDGLISQVLTVPPLTAGVVVDIADPLMSVKSWDEYTMLFGATSSMVMFTVVEADPPLLLAQIVYIAAVVCRTLGVPLIAPVLELNVRPRPAIDGLISQLVTVPPLTLGVFVDIVTPLVKSISCGE